MIAGVIFSAQLPYISNLLFTPKENIFLTDFFVHTDALCRIRTIVIICVKNRASCIAAPLHPPKTP